MKVVVLPRSRVELAAALGFGTFNTALFVLPFFVEPGLNDYGRNIGTKWSLISVGVLWPVVVYCTFRAWLELGAPLRNRVEAESILPPAMMWGCIAGATFFFVLLTIGATSNAIIGIRDDETHRLGDSFFTMLFYGTFGSGIAGGFGSVIGLATGAIDIGLLRFGQRLSRLA